MSKHTIRDILPPEHRQNKKAPMREEIQDDTPVEPPVRKKKPTPLFESRGPRRPVPPRPNRGGKAKYAYYGGGVLALIVVLSLVFSMFFAGAEVIVKPKTDTLTVNGDFSAVANNPSSGQLQYEIMTLEALQTRTVPATGSEEVEEKASGQITIFNEYNDSPQRLIRNTRFETPEGLIYRIDKSVVVPGMTDGQPGSIEVTVYADEAGESYNIGLTDFTIPGFKGAPQFEDFYATSKSEMTGGFVGQRLKVEDSVLESERTNLHAQLEQDLLAQLEGQKPAGFTSFSNSIFVEFTSETPAEVGNDVEIREKAVLYNVLFDDAALAGYLADNTLSSFDDSSVTFLGEPSLNITPKPLEEDGDIAPWRDGEFSFSMSGTAPIVWTFDEESLKTDLSSRNKEAIHTILSGYPSIDEAEVVIRPFWKGSFPANLEEITIETVLPES